MFRREFIQAIAAFSAFQCRSPIGLPQEERMLASTVKICTESSQRFSELVRFCSEHDIELMVDSDTCPQLPGKTLISITAYQRCHGPGCIATDILSNPGEASGVIDRMSRSMLANLRNMIGKQWTGSP